MNIVGHVVSADVVLQDHFKTSRVIEWPTSRLLQEVQHSLSLAKHYRDFITNCDTIAKLLEQVAERRISLSKLSIVPKLLFG